MVRISAILMHTYNIINLRLTHLRPGVLCSQQTAGEKSIPRTDSDVIPIKNKTKGVLCLTLNLAVLYFNMCYKANVSFLLF